MSIRRIRRSIRGRRREKEEDEEEEEEEEEDIARKGVQNRHH